MKLFSRLVLIMLAFAMIVCADGQVFAQQGGRGGRGGRGRMSPEQVQQRMKEFMQRRLDGLKERLEVSDEEWGVLKPEIEKIWKIQGQMRRFGGGFMGAFGRFGRGRRGEGDESALGRARRELEEAIKENGDIKGKLGAYRTAVKDAEKKREELEKKLAQAREDLKALLTIKQEAVLVLYGTLP